MTDSTRIEMPNGITILTCQACDVSEEYLTDKLHDLYDPQCGNPECRAPQMGAYI